VSYPAAYAGALAVSAVRFDRTLAPYSSFGPEVDLAAPGGDTSVDQNSDGLPDGVLQQTIGGEFKWFQGTSMATPHVAAAAALLAGAGVTRAEAIERVLMQTATPLGEKNRFGAGEVDAAAALKHVRLFGGLWRFGLAILLLLFGRWVVRRNGEKPSPLGVIAFLLLLWSSAGFLFVPFLGLGHSTIGSALQTPLPEWGQHLHGAMTSSILWLSALGAFLALGLSRWTRIRPLAVAVCFGYAAYLIHAAVTGWVDIGWLPGRTVEAAWLALNGALAFGFGTIALRHHSR
jgi:serine protease